MLRTLWLIALAALALGCGGDGDEPGGTGPDPADATVRATLANTFSPSQVTVPPNGVVAFRFEALHNVQFDDGNPAGTPSDIPDRASGTVRRTFAAAGTFEYECTIHPGMSGRVVVQ